MDCSPPGFSVHRILQARTQEWVAMPSSRGSYQPRDKTCFSYISLLAVGFFITNALLYFASNLRQINYILSVAALHHNVIILLKMAVTMTNTIFKLISAVLLIVSKGKLGFVVLHRVRKNIPSKEKSNNSMIRDYGSLE